MILNLFPNDVEKKFRYEILPFVRRLGSFDRNFDVVFVPYQCSPIDAENITTMMWAHMITVEDFFSLPEHFFAEMKIAETFWLKNEYCPESVDNFLIKDKNRFMRGCPGKKILFPCEDVENEKFGFLIKANIFVGWKMNVATLNDGDKTW